MERGLSALRPAALLKKRLWHRAKYVRKMYFHGVLKEH